MDPQGRAVAAKTQIDAKFVGLIKDGTVADTVADVKDVGDEMSPSVSIHLAHEQADQDVVRKLWNETAEFREMGVDISILHRTPGQEDEIFRG